MQVEIHKFSDPVKTQELDPKEFNYKHFTPSLDLIVDHAIKILDSGENFTVKYAVAGADDCYVTVTDTHTESWVRYFYCMGTDSGLYD